MDSSDKPACQLKTPRDLHRWSRTEGSSSCCSVTQSSLTLCALMDSSTPGFPVLHYLPVRKFMSIELVMLSNHLILCVPLLLLPSVFCSIKGSLHQVAKSIGTSTSASVLPMNIHGLFPLGLTSLISLQSKGLSKVFFSTTIRKHEFFRAQSSLWSSSHIHIRLLEKP